MSPGSRWLPASACFAITLTGVLAWPGQGLAADAQQSASALQARHAELQTQLRANAFGQPLVLTSREGDHQLEGDVHAEVPHPFERVAASFKSAAVVCETLILHLNVHSCEPSSSASEESVNMLVGPKKAHSAATLHRMTYAIRTEAATDNYFRATLVAAAGPLSTRDYRIVVEAMPIDAGRTFFHLGYSYAFGTLAKVAMQTYLATAGRSKIGFTVVGQGADGRPQYVRGERGSLERNVMRYYLALLAATSVNTGTPAQRTEARLRAWFAMTEKYAPQLHELELAEYLQEKREDLARSRMQ